VRSSGAVALAAGAVLAGAATWIGLAPTTACTPNGCNPTTASYPDDGGPGGEMVDENTYETSPIQEPASGPGSNEPWVLYPGMVTLAVTFPPAARAVIGQRQPLSIDSYVGIAPQPDDTPGANFTEISGGLVEFAEAGADGFHVTNDTCSKYWARFVVHFPALPANVPDASE